MKPMEITNQKPTTDIQKLERKQQKHTAKESHQTTRKRNKKKGRKTMAENKGFFDYFKKYTPYSEQEKEILLSLSRSQFAALDTANANYSANRNILEKLKFDYNNLIGQQSKAEEEMIRLSSEYDAAKERIAALTEFRSRRAMEMGELDEKFDEFGQKVNELLIVIAETRKDIESVQLMVDNIEGRINELNAERDTQNAK